VLALVTDGLPEEAGGENEPRRIPESEFLEQGKRAERKQRRERTSSRRKAEDRRKNGRARGKRAKRGT